MAIGDLFSVVAEWQHSNGQFANWQFHVRCIADGSGTGDSPNLAIVVRNSLDSLMVNKVHQIWTPGAVRVQNLTNFDDISEQFMTYTSTRADNPLPSFLAVGIRSAPPGRGYNRGRANLPLGGETYNSSLGNLTSAALEEVEPVAAYAGSNRVAASTGEQWQPCTVRYIYVNKVLQSVELRKPTVGLWQIDGEFTTVNSRKRYLWTDID